MIFDTNEFVKKLVAAGMDEAQAAIIAEEHLKLSNVVREPELQRVKFEICEKIEKKANVITGLIIFATFIAAVLTVASSG